MAKLIIVHEGRSNTELLLNVDHIIYARSAPSEVTPSETSVGLLEHHIFAIRETVHQLLALSEAAEEK